VKFRNETFVRAAVAAFPPSRALAPPLIGSQRRHRFSAQSRHGEVEVRLEDLRVWESTDRRALVLRDSRAGQWHCARAMARC
jgi:hypothetical protein